MTAFSWRLTQALRRWRPTILHSYLVEPSILGLIAGRLARVPRIVWGMRTSNVDFSKYDAATGLTFRVAAISSTLVDLIVTNSEAGRRYHVTRGFPARRVVTIPNGIDTGRFRPSCDARTGTREQWGVGAATSSWEWPLVSTR